MAGMSAFGQTPPPSQTPRRPTPPVQATTPSPSVTPTTAPQVVTVLHRLNGLKMFRLLLHSEQGAEAIANLDETFKLMDDVHTNVIAGLALEDGETIAARLPEVEVESTFPFAYHRAPFAPTTDPLAGFRGNLLESPDLTVIDSEGKRMSARFVGVDGSTGLSILRISSRLPHLRGRRKTTISSESEPVFVYLDQNQRHLNNSELVTSTFEWVNRQGRYPMCCKRRPVMSHVSKHVR